MICTYKSALTHRFHCKGCLKISCLGREYMQEGGSKKFAPLWGGLVMLDFWRDPGRSSGCLPHRQEPRSQLKVKGRRQGVPPGTLPPPFLLLGPHLLHVTAGTEGSRSRSRGDEAAAALPAPAQLSLRKGNRSPRRGRGAPCRAAPPRIPGVSWNGHSTILTWRFPREPREFED